MSRILETTVYKFSELTPKAKETARDWWREASAGDSYFSESVIEDAVTIAALFGLTIKTSQESYSVIRRKGPATQHTRERTHVFFSGFSSQGDGACFEGDYTFKADALAAVKDYAPTDTRLHAIVADLDAAQAAAGNRIACRVTHGSNHYSHARTMDFEFAIDESDDPEVLPVVSQAECDAQESLIDFANWIYRQLEAAYEHENSDEFINETLEANDYEFTADGKRCAPI